MISCCGNVKAESYPEFIVAYQIHLLAHHPDKQQQDTHLENELKFILNCILKSPNPNMALIWKILAKIRQAEDGQKGNRQTARLHKFVDLAAKFIKINFRGHKESKFGQPFNLPSSNYEAVRRENHHMKGARSSPLSNQRIVSQRSSPSSNQRIVSRSKRGRHVLSSIKRSMFTASPINTVRRPHASKDKQILFRKPLKPQKIEKLQTLSPLKLRPTKRAKLATSESQSTQSSGSSSIAQLHPADQIQGQNPQNTVIMKSPSSTSKSVVTESSRSPLLSTGSNRKVTESSQSSKLTGLDNSSQSSLF
jgi:hypothetical protein